MMDDHDRASIAVALARHLWKQLRDDRREHLLPLMSPAMREIIDPEFEAAMIIQHREGLYVEPGDHAGEYLLVYPNGRSVVLESDALLMMAGTHPGMADFLDIGRGLS